MHQQANTEAWERLTDQQQRFFSLLDAEQSGELFSVEQNGASASLFPRGDAIYLSMIQTSFGSYRRQGRASGLLKRLCAVAGQVQVVIRLKVEPKGLIDLNDGQLTEWYRRNGFAGDTADMTRPPATPPRDAESG